MPWKENPGTCHFKRKLRLRLCWSVLECICPGILFKLSHCGNWQKAATACGVAQEHICVFAWVWGLLFALYFTELKRFIKLCVSLEVTNLLQSKFFHHSLEKALLLHVDPSPVGRRKYTTVTIHFITFVLSGRERIPWAMVAAKGLPSLAGLQSNSSLFALSQPILGKSSSLCQDLIPGDSRSAFLNTASFLLLFLFFY